MSDWTADELDIAPLRPDGSLRPYTTIWVVRVGDGLYVRSYRGRGGSWFRHAVRRHQGRIRTGGVERDVTFEKPTMRTMPRSNGRQQWQTTAENKEPSGAQKMFGDFAPTLVGFTDDVLFGQVWKRQDLSPKERSLVTVASLTTSGNTDQLVYHLGLAKENGATEEELIEAVTHLAFYAGWPKAMSATAVAKQVFRGNQD